MKPLLVTIGATLAMAACAPANPTPRAPDRNRPHVEQPREVLVPSALLTNPEPPPALSSKVASEPASPPFPEPVRVEADALAMLYCLNGGARFSPLGAAQSDDDRFYHPLSCDEVTRTITAADAGTFLIDLMVAPSFAEESQYLYFPDKRAAVFLSTGWSAGVGGFSHQLEMDPIKTGDVYGDHELELWTVASSSWLDDDMGSCERHGEMRRDLVLCTQDNGRFGCFALVLEQSSFYDVVAIPGGQPSECSVPRHLGEGFAQTAVVSRDLVTLTPTGEVFQRPKAAPFTGQVSIAKLLERAKATIVRL
ncbi:MAG: hypothetical protein U0271_28080 [Polyangiaceae bacterium]